jgi:hypothetical protein
MMGKQQSASCQASFDKLRKSLRKNIQTIVKNTSGYPRIPRGNETFDAGCFLVCALIQTGPHTGPIARITGLSHRQCALWGVKARELGIMTRGGVSADPWVDPACELAATVNFCCDVLTLTGQIERIGPRDENALYARKA